MIFVRGPFAADPNINVLTFAFDDRVWVLNRPAIDEPIAAGTFGVLEFDDVRAYRCGGSSRPDVLIPAEAWALEFEQSDYLTQSIALDEQRDAHALRHHKHFAIRDGNHRLLDVIARHVSVSAFESPPGGVGLQAFLANALAEFD